jgi:SAM-dependent methyltransferase
MHQQIADFFMFVRTHMKQYFSGVKLVLDVGSGDVNGNNRQFFDETCTIHGNDVYPGRNVDLIYRTAELPFLQPTFDTIISSECFQHDPEYVDSLKKIVSILRPGGLFVMSCASTGCKEHGTRKHFPEKSFATKGNLSKWRDYYKALTFEDIRAAIDLDAVFCKYGAYYNSKTQDLYFYGVKKDPKRPALQLAIPDYTGPTIRNLIPPPTPPKIQSQPPAEPVPTSVVHPAPVTIEELTPQEAMLVEQYLAASGRI